MGWLNLMARESYSKWGRKEKCASQADSCAVTGQKLWTMQSAHQGLSTTGPLNSCTPTSGYPYWVELVGLSGHSDVMVQNREIVVRLSV